MPNVFALTINFAEYQDPARLEIHKEKIQESLLKTNEDAKESNKKSQEKQKLEYGKEINKLKLKDIYLNDEVLVHKLVTKRTKGGSLKATFTRPFKIEAANQNSYKVNRNNKLHSCNLANVKKGMHYLFLFFLYIHGKQNLCQPDI